MLIEIIENEKECVKRASLPFGCDRHCEDCDLVRPTEEILWAYDKVLDILRRMEDDLK